MHRHLHRERIQPNGFTLHELFLRGSAPLDPGSIRARILGAVDAEARRALDEGVATATDIDRALRLGAGHPEGPFERMARAGTS